MDAGKLKQIVLEQRGEIETVSGTENLVDREFMDVKRYLEHPNILSVLGVRRCGKSTFSVMLLENKVYGYINFDDERLIGFGTEDLNKLLQVFYELYGGELEYLIFDEIQNVPGWELFVTRLRRTKKVIITGSNSKMLSGELATHLTGRRIDCVLYPFSFREFLRYRDVKLPGNVLTTKDRANLFNELNDYLLYGGFPERFKFGNAITERIYSDIITKDVIFRHNIKLRDDLIKLSRFLLSNYSCEFTYSSLRKISNVKHINTISNWISHLEDAYLLYRLERFSYKLKQQILAPKKIYCVDNGIITVAAFNSSPNKGRLMENTVYIELRRRTARNPGMQELYYWKDHSQREVDFVIKEGPKIKQLIQVCMDSCNDKTKERETKSLLKASEELMCVNLLIITWDHEARETIGDKTIKYTPLWKWLLTDDGGG